MSFLFYLYKNLKKYALLHDKMKVATFLMVSGGIYVPIARAVVSMHISGKSNINLLRPIVPFSYRAIKA